MGLALDVVVYTSFEGWQFVLDMTICNILSYSQAVGNLGMDVGYSPHISDLDGDDFLLSILCIGKR